MSEIVLHYTVFPTAILVVINEDLIALCEIGFLTEGEGGAKVRIFKNKPFSSRIQLEYTVCSRSKSYNLFKLSDIKVLQ